jgi:putative endonuclease
MFYTYILRCADDTFYIGSTNNLEKRLHEHNHAKSGAHYTKLRRPVVLVWNERHATLGEARSREAALKHLTRAEKIAMIGK